MVYELTFKSTRKVEMAREHIPRADLAPTTIALAAGAVGLVARLAAISTR